MNAREFADRVLGIELWPHQVEAADSEAFVTAVAAARRVGKTTLAEVMACHAAFSARDATVLWLSATQDAARRNVESIGRRLSANRLTRGAVTEDFASRVRLTNGSQIVSLPASQRQVRGYGEGVRLVILDEAGFMDESMWQAAHYTALDERAAGSRIFLLGTPWGPDGHFFRRAFEAGRDGDPDHAAHQWTYRANPRLDHAYLERQRDRVSPMEYAAEVLGEWSEASGSLFPQRLLRAATVDVELPRAVEVPGNARGALGLDWGVSFDQSTACGVWRLPVAALNPDREPLPTFLAAAQAWRAGTLLHEVVDAVAASGAPWRYVSTETNGVGAGPSQQLARVLRPRLPRPRTWNPVATTNPKKTAAYAAVLTLLERGQLLLPRDPDLLRQLAGLRFEHGARGFTKIAAGDDAVHDDLADGLALAMGPYDRRGVPKVGCAVLTLATAADAPPDHPSALLADEPVVESGGGLRVHARPPLQSVDGEPLVTLPDGARLADAASPEAEIPLARRAPDTDPDRRRP